MRSWSPSSLDTHQGTAAPVRARHERADARSHRDLPLRGARHLPAHGGARGTRRAQEGPVGVLAQRAPGEPLPRRAHARREQGADRPRPRPALELTHQPRQAPGERAALLPDEAALARAAREPARPGGGQRDPLAHTGALQGISGHARDAGVEGHQPAHQGRGARHPRRGLLQRQDHGGRGRPLHRPHGATGGLLGKPLEGHALLETGRPHVLRSLGARCARLATQPGRVRGHRRA